MIMKRNKKKGGGGKGVLSSFGLAVAVMLCAAFFSAVGTIVPQGRDLAGYRELYGPAAARLITYLHLDNWFHSPVFVGFLALFAAHVLYCLLRRAPSYLKRSLSGSVRDGTRPFGFLMLHAGLLVVLGAGGFTSWTGYIGTANIYVGDKTDLFYDWKLQSEERLPFSVEVISPEPEFYPVRARIGIRDTGGRIYGLWETAEGRSFEVPPLDLVVRTAAIDVERGTFTIEARIGDRIEKLVTPFAPGMPNSARFGDFEVVLVAWRRDLKMVGSRIRVQDGGRTAAEGMISINSPMRYGDYRIYQRDLGSDPYVNPYSGYQVVREPGLPMVWAGCVIVLLGLAASVTGRFISPKPEQNT